MLLSAYPAPSYPARTYISKHSQEADDGEEGSDEGDLIYVSSPSSDDGAPAMYGDRYHTTQHHPSSSQQQQHSFFTSASAYEAGSQHRLLPAAAAASWDQSCVLIDPPASWAAAYPDPYADPPSPLLSFSGGGGGGSGVSACGEGVGEGVAMSDGGDAQDLGYAYDPYFATFDEFVQDITRRSFAPSTTARAAFVNTMSTSVLEDWLLRSHIQQLVLANRDQPFCLCTVSRLENDPVAKFYLRFVGGNEPICRVIECTMSEFLTVCDERRIMTPEQPLNIKFRQTLDNFVLSKPDPANAALWVCVRASTFKGRIVDIYARIQVFFTPQLEPALLVSVLHGWRSIDEPQPDAWNVVPGSPLQKIEEIP